MSFEIDDVLSAMEAVKSTNPEEQDEALRYIYDWQATPSSITQAVDIILNEEITDHRIIYYSLQCAYQNIKKHWISYDPDFRDHVREQFAIKMTELNSEEDKELRKVTIRIIVELVLKDYPEQWPSCLDDLIETAKADPNMCNLDFEILSKIINAVYKSQDITTTRREILINEVQGHVDAILDMIEVCLTDERFEFDNIKVAFIRLICPLCIFAPPERLLRPGLCEAMLTTYVQDDDMRKYTIKAVKNLFLERPDPESVFDETVEDVLFSFLRTFNPPELPEKDPNAPQDEDERDLSELEFHEEFFNFALLYMDRYAEKIEDYCYPDDNGNEEFIDLVQNVYVGIMNNYPKDEHNEEFWLLWRGILSRMCRAFKSVNRFDALKPVTLLFEDVLEMLREALYMALPSALGGGKVASVSVMMCWMFMAKLNVEAMVEFLGEQSIEVHLPYAYGLVDCMLPNRIEQEEYLKRLVEMIGVNEGEESIEFGIALLYMLSRATRLISQPQLAVAFADNLCQFLGHDDEDVVKCAASALHYTAFRLPSMYLIEHDGQYLVMHVIGALSGVDEFEEKPAVQVMTSVANVAAIVPERDVQDQIYDSILGVVRNLFSADETIMRGIAVVNAIARLKLPNLREHLLTFADALTELAAGVAAGGVSTLYFKEATATLMTIFANFEFQEVSEPAEKLMEVIMSATAMPESAIFAACDFREVFPAADPIYYDGLNENFVQPLISTFGDDMVAVEPVLHFFRAFTIREDVVPMLFEMSTNCITDSRVAVAREASKLLRLLIVRALENQSTGQVVEDRANIVGSIFSALTDTFHNEIFNSLTQTLKFFYDAIAVSNIDKNGFDRECVRIVEGCVQRSLLRLEPGKNEDDPGFAALMGEFKDLIAAFPSEIRKWRSNIEKFRETIRNMLIATRSASATDKRLFKKGIRLSSLRKELEELAIEEQKSAIKAEELELLPMLEKFSFKNK